MLDRFEVRVQWSVSIWTREISVITQMKYLINFLHDNPVITIIQSELAIVFSVCKLLIK